jgi:glutamyl-Q tRNA(Asp) synthetase
MNRQMNETACYRGRFAPSPTGPLHFGSLVAALGSFLDARHHHGSWLVRMEDLDPPREMPGAADRILRTLETFGLEWDGPVEYQSRRSDLYTAALARLERTGHLYGCACTRKEIADGQTGSKDNPVYPGTCRHGLPPGRTARTMRVRVTERMIPFRDILQGAICQQLDREVGDFVLRRADGLFAYQLAVVVDDAEQQISHVVRGSDLLDSTPRQIHLQQLLGYPEPAYLHLPVAVNAQLEKLGKQTLAPAIPHDRKAATLLQALRFLDQPLPPSAHTCDLPELLAWATAHWDRNALPACRTRIAPTGFQQGTPVT